MSDLVGNPEDRFSCVVAQLISFITHPDVVFHVFFSVEMKAAAAAAEAKKAAAKGKH